MVLIGRSSDAPASSSRWRSWVDNLLVVSPLTATRWVPSRGTSTCSYVQLYGTGRPVTEQQICRYANFLSDFSNINIDVYFACSANLNMHMVENNFTKKSLNLIPDYKIWNTHWNTFSFGGRQQKQEISLSTGGTGRNIVQRSKQKNHKIYSLPI